MVPLTPFQPTTAADDASKAMTTIMGQLKTFNTTKAAGGGHRRKRAAQRRRVRKQAGGDVGAATAHACLRELLQNDASLREYYTAMLGGPEGGLLNVLGGGVEGADLNQGFLVLDPHAAHAAPSCAITLPDPAASSLFAGGTGVDDLGLLLVGGDDGFGIDDFGEANVPHYEPGVGALDDNSGDDQVGEWELFGRAVSEPQLASLASLGWDEEHVAQQRARPRGPQVDARTRFSSAVMRRNLETGASTVGTWHASRVEDGVRQARLDAWRAVGWRPRVFAHHATELRPQVAPALRNLLQSSLSLEPAPPAERRAWASGLDLSFAASAAPDPLSDGDTFSGEWDEAFAVAWDEAEDAEPSAERSLGALLEASMGPERARSSQPARSGDVA